MKKGRPSMKISKEEFPKHLSAYTEDEKFYRDVYLHEKEHPETFKEYLDTLDPEYISRHRLYVPGISASNTLLRYLHRIPCSREISFRISQRASYAVMGNAPAVS